MLPRNCRNLPSSLAPARTAPAPAPAPLSASLSTSTTLVSSSPFTLSPTFPVCHLSPSGLQKHFALVPSDGALLLTVTTARFLLPGLAAPHPVVAHLFCKRFPLRVSGTRRHPRLCFLVRELFCRVFGWHFVLSSNVRVSKALFAVVTFKATQISEGGGNNPGVIAPRWPVRARTLHENDGYPKRGVEIFRRNQSAPVVTVV